MEGRLKGVMKQANKEKALKQVVKATLNENILKLATTKRRATSTEMAQELAEQKVKAL